MVLCPRLGHLIYFSYCRSEEHGLPCFKILDCWYDHFLVEEFLRKELTEQEWERLFTAQPKAKIASLVELIEEAKKKDKEHT